MKDWTDYSKLKSNNGSTQDSNPKIREYIMIKVTDNALVIGIFILCLIFGLIGLFSDITEKNSGWSLHAAELCLGVFLGLIKKGK